MRSATFFLTPADRENSKKIDFDKLMIKIKAIEQRIILYKASKESFCVQNNLVYDPFYHTYSAYRLLQIKHKYNIYRTID